MEQMTGYALLGIGNAESPEMMHERVQEAFAMAEKMLQNSIGTVEYKGKTMDEWVKSIKKLQQYEERLREATKKVEQLQAERDAAVNDLHKAVNSPVALNACRFCENNKACAHDGTCDVYENDRWQWRGVQKGGDGNDS